LGSEGGTVPSQLDLPRALRVHISTPKSTPRSTPRCDEAVASESQRAVKGKSKDGSAQPAAESGASQRSRNS